MKTFSHVFLGILISMMGLSSIQAQSKKQLQAEVERLRGEIEALYQENTLLRQQRDRLEQQNSSLVGSESASQAEIERLSRQIDILEQDYAALSASYEALKKETPTGGIASGYGNTGPDRSEPSTCAMLESQLSDNTSYTLNYNRLNTSGWGVQVYSFSSLCTAEAKAKSFSQQYKMYNTYIRVKRVNGRRIYSVVYGSLRDEQQARTYCKNFRKIAKDKAGKSAFIVQH